MVRKSVKTDAEKLLEKHDHLIHSVDQKVLSHVQRSTDDWVMHTVIVEGCDVPFKFKRKDKYLSLKGAVVNLTYYTGTETVAGLTFDVMHVVRVKRA